MTQRRYPQSIRFDEDLEDAARAYAAANGRSFADAINWLVRLGLDREGLKTLPTGAVTASPPKAPAHKDHPRAAGVKGA